MPKFNEELIAEMRAHFKRVDTLAAMYGLDWVGADRDADNNPKYPADAVLRMSEYVSDVDYDFEDCDEFAVYGFDWMSEATACYAAGIKRGEGIGCRNKH